MKILRIWHKANKSDTYKKNCGQNTKTIKLEKYFSEEQIIRMKIDKINHLLKITRTDDLSSRSELNKQKAELETSLSAIQLKNAQQQRTAQKAEDERTNPNGCNVRDWFGSDFV